jgi:peptidoglycan/LPS O-acetylase OafA/YrhL
MVGEARKPVTVASGIIRRRLVLRFVLIASGLGFLMTYPLMRLWPAAWTWQPAHADYEVMIAVIYAVLGAFVIRAAANPDEHVSLIWFVIWSSLIHGGLMAVMAAADPGETSHFLGDVPALAIVAVALASLVPGGLLDRISPVPAAATAH